MRCSIVTLAGGVLLALVAPLVAQQRQDGPIDASSSDPVPSLIPYVNSDGGLDVVWRRVDGKLMYSRFAAGDPQGNTFEVRDALDLLGGFTKDERGNAFIVTAVNEKVGLIDENGQRRVGRQWRPGVLKLQRIPPQGRRPDLEIDLNQEAYTKKKGVFNPIRLTGLTATSKLAYGDGTIAFAFGHNSPGSDNILHNTGGLLSVDADGNSVYNEGAGQHTTGNQIWYLEDAFVKLQEGDQGILMSRLKRGADGRWSWSKDKLVYRHQTADPGNAAPDLNEFVRCGNVVEADGRYMLVFSGTRGEGTLQCAPHVEVHPSVKGASLSLLFVPKEGFDALPGFKFPENPVGNGIRVQVVARPQGDSNLVRPRIIDVGDGKFTLKYEQWSSKNKYESTHAMQIDANGRVTAPSTGPLQGNPRSQHRGEAFLINGECGWIAGDNANKRIVLHILTGVSKVRSIDLRVD